MGDATSADRFTVVGEDILLDPSMHPALRLAVDMIGAAFRDSASYRAYIEPLTDTDKTNARFSVLLAQAASEQVSGYHQEAVWYQAAIANWLDGSALLSTSLPSLDEIHESGLVAELSIDIFGDQPQYEGEMARFNDTRRNVATQVAEALCLSTKLQPVATLCPDLSRLSAAAALHAVVAAEAGDAQTAAHACREAAYLAFHCFQFGDDCMPIADAMRDVAVRYSGVRA